MNLLLYKKILLKIHFSSENDTSKEVAVFILAKFAFFHNNRLSNIFYWGFSQFPQLNLSNVIKLLPKQSHFSKQLRKYFFLHCLWNKFSSIFFRLSFHRLIKFSFALKTLKKWKQAKTFFSTRFSGLAKILWKTQNLFMALWWLWFDGNFCLVEKQARWS